MAKPLHVFVVFRDRAQLCNLELIILSPEYGDYRLVPPDPGGTHICILGQCSPTDLSPWPSFRFCFETGSQEVAEASNSVLPSSWNSRIVSQP